MYFQDNPAFPSSQIYAQEGDIALATSPAGAVPISRLLVTENGNVGIGITSPSNKLSVLGNADISGNVGIGTTNPTAKLEVVDISFGIGVKGQSTSFFGTGVEGQSTSGSGVVGRTNNSSEPGVRAVSANQSEDNLGLHVVGRAFIAGVVDLGGLIPAGTYRLQIPNIAAASGRGLANRWDTYSSRRWKTNIQTIQGALEKVERLRGVSFDWKENGGHDIGLIAEEVGEVVPEVVGYEENGKDARSLDYARLTAVLIEAVKDQKKIIEELKKKTSEIDELKAEVEGLKAKLSGGQLVSVPVSGVHDEP